MFWQRFVKKLANSRNQNERFCKNMSCRHRFAEWGDLHDLINGQIFTRAKKCRSSHVNMTSAYPKRLIES